MSSRSKIGNATLVFAYVCLVVFLTGSFAKASAGPEVFEYRDGLISLKGDGLSLLSLLQRISESAGIELLVVGPINPHPVIVDMVDKPVEEAIRSILRDYSYAAVYSDGSAGQVNIIGARVGRETNQNARNANDQNLLTNPLVTSQKNRVSRIDFPLTPASSTGQAPLFAPEGKKGVGNVDRTSREQTLAVQNHEAIAQRAIAQRVTNREQTEPNAMTGKTGTEQTGATEQQTGATQQQAEAIARAAMATREVGGEYSVFIEELERRIESGQSDRDYELWSGIRGPRYVVHDRVRLERYRELIEDGS